MPDNTSQNSINNDLNPLTPSYSDNVSQGMNPGVAGLNTGAGTNQESPLTNLQYAQLFSNRNGNVDPNNNIGSNIAGGFNLQNTQNFGNAPVNNVSPLAGLTTLGKVANAPVTNAGNTNINTAVSNNLTSGQMQQINALNAQAQGQGPSLAAIQAQQTGQQNVANQMAMVGSQRGSANSALGMRAAGNATTAANQQAVQAAVQGRAAEELSAQQQLTGALGGAQGQVMGGAQAQAQLGQNINIANQNSANSIYASNAAQQNAAMSQQGSLAQQIALANQGVLQQTGLANLGQAGTTQTLNANEYNAMLQAQMTQASNQQTANENYATSTSNNALQALANHDKTQQIATANMMGLAGAGIAGGAALGAAGIASDINLKTSVKSGTRSIKDFLSAISSHTAFDLMETI